MTLVMCLLGGWLLASLVLGGVFAGVGRSRPACSDDEPSSAAALPRQKTPAD